MFKNFLKPKFLKDNLLNLFISLSFLFFSLSLFSPFLNLGVDESFLLYQLFKIERSIFFIINLQLFTCFMIIKFRKNILNSYLLNIYNLYIFFLLLSFFLIFCSEFAYERYTDQNWKQNIADYLLSINSTFYYGGDILHNYGIHLPYLTNFSLFQLLGDKFSKDYKSIVIMILQFLFLTYICYFISRHYKVNKHISLICSVFASIFLSIPLSPLHIFNTLLGFHWGEQRIYLSLLFLILLKINSKNTFNKNIFLTSLFFIILSYSTYFYAIDSFFMITSTFVIFLANFFSLILKEKKKEALFISKLFFIPALLFILIFFDFIVDLYKFSYFEFLTENLILEKKKLGSDSISIFHIALREKNIFTIILYVLPFSYFFSRTLRKYNFSELLLITCLSHISVIVLGYFNYFTSHFTVSFYYVDYNFLALNILCVFLLTYNFLIQIKFIKNIKLVTILLLVLFINDRVFYMLKNSNYSDKSYLNFPPADPEKIFSILKKAKIKDNKQYQGKVLLIFDFDENIWAQTHKYIKEKIKKKFKNDLYLDLYSWNIPLVNEYGHSTSPQRFIFNYLSYTKKNYRSFDRAVLPLNNFNYNLAATDGVRFLITNVVHENKSLILISSQNLEGSKIYIYELKNTNLGNFSPTKGYIDYDNKQFLTKINSNINFQKEFFVSKTKSIEPEILNKLSKAYDIKFSKIEDKLGFTFEAKSKGWSIIVLPIDFSHCLNFTNKSTFKVFPINLLQTGILFTNYINTEIIYKYSVIGENSSCRNKDFKKFQNVLSGISLK